MQLLLNLEPNPPLPNPEGPIPNPQSPIPNPQSLIPNPQSLIPVLMFVRHPRARRYLIRVTDERTVRVTIPRGGSRREAAAFAEREHAWIEKQLRERERRTTNGGPGGPNVERHDVDRRTLIARARRELPPRLLELAAQYGLTVSRISIRNQRSRWGSCSRRGHICLNWRLVTMPEDVKDYVLIHELMHLRRMDHSPKFWKLVAAACPAYQDARRWLRQAGRP
jgi:predicted metal-dependent hydrolase